MNSSIIQSMSYKRIKVLVVRDLYLIGSKGYKLYKCTYDSNLYELIGKVKNKYARFSYTRLISRLTRSEITQYHTLCQGEGIVVSKKYIGIKLPPFQCFDKSFTIPRGSKPLNLCILPNGHIYFGEYFQNMEKKAVNVYGSKDNGRTWNIVYSFPDGSINHIHGLFYDKYTGRMWVLTGDRENECIIGYTEDEFKTFVKVFRGGQEYRSCQLFFYPDFIVFATDTQYAQNKIKCFDRKTLEIKELVDIQGSAIKGGQVGNVSFLSTTVEPSDVNKDKYAHIWLTKDGLHWEDVYKAKKDWLPSIFQFGTFEFPQYETEKIERLYFYGRALKGLDGKTSYIDL